MQINGRNNAGIATSITVQSTVQQHPGGECDITVIHLQLLVLVLKPLLDRFCGLL